jgi:dTMP kinase
MQNKYIAFCGVDGSGKSTQSKMLYNTLSDILIPVDLSKEPTDGPVGTLIREILSGEKKVTNETLETLFKLDRKEHDVYINTLIKKGITCISDRSIISGIAYNTNKSKSLSDLFMEVKNENVLLPDIVFFIDIPIQTALDRINLRCKDLNIKPDIYESKEKLILIRDRFLRILNYYKEKKLINIYIINGNNSPEKIQEEILELYYSSRED